MEWTVETASAGLPVIEAVTDYEKIKRIGEGTYGTVYKARNRKTGEIVALKKLRMEQERDGMPVTSVRELRVLQLCRHPNVVELKKVVTGSKLDSVFLVFEYCFHELGRLLDTMTRPFSQSEVKCLMQQLLTVVDFLHARCVMHRDLKLSNLLLTGEGRLKLCDFGLARSFSAYEESYTPRVVTLWYRAPEVLLGLETYTEAIDMWAVGCIFGELLKHEPIFPAKSELQMLEMMACLLGTPHDGIWPGFSSLPLASTMKLPHQPYNYVEREFPAVSASGLDLLNRLLTFDPAQRITARAARRHTFFREHPLPKAPRDMPTFPSAHDAGASGRHQRRAEMDGADDKLRQKRAQEKADSRFGDAFGQAGIVSRGVKRSWWQ